MRLDGKIDLRLDVYVHLGDGALHSALRTILNAITHTGDKIMATIQELNDKVAAMNAASDAERQEVLTALQAFRDQVKALQDQIAAGSPASQADLDALGTALDDAITRVQGVITDADK